MACSLQKLFAVGEEFEDEDFLSAVEDAESRCAGPWSVRAPCLRPDPSRPRDSVSVQASGQQPACPPAPPEAPGRPALGLRLPAVSLHRVPASSGTAAPGPEAPSCDQKQATRSKVGTPPSAPYPRLDFESQQQGLGDFEGPEQDEFDKVLANMELEGPGLEPTLGICRAASGVLPSWPREDSLLASKAWGADLSQSGLKGPRPAAHTAGSVPAQDEPPVPHAPSGPTAVVAPVASAAAAQHARLGACPQEPPFRAPHPLQAAGGPLRSSLRGHIPGQRCPSPKAGLSSKPRFPGPRTPSAAASSPSAPGPRPFPQRPFPLGAPRPCGDSPVGTPRAPQVALQTPIVTNRLVQLISAASRPPQQLPCPGTHAKARRFPGPAGALPHQHSGKNLEEIMVSTPQTPTHGALAKLRTKVVTSSQASLEEDFGQGPWLTMKSALGLDERDPACFLRAHSIAMVLRKAALRQLPRNKVPSMAVMIKSLTRSTVDASAVFRDPTGEMQGTVHRLLLESRHSELKPGSVLLLKQVGVFSPSLRNHYLNVTPSNLVRIYCSDTSNEGLAMEPEISQEGLLQDMTGKSEKGLAPAQSPETGAPPEEELPEADDLDGLLRELPEDFFCGTSTWGHPQAGQPP